MSPGCVGEVLHNDLANTPEATRGKLCLGLVQDCLDGRIGIEPLVRACEFRPLHPDKRKETVGVFARQLQRKFVGSRTISGAGRAGVVTRHDDLPRDVIATHDLDYHIPIE